MVGQANKPTVRQLAQSSRLWFFLIALVMIYPVFLQNFDSEVYSFGARFIINKISASTLYIGLTATGYVAGITVFSLFGGYLFDKISPKGAVLTGLTIFSVFSALSGQASSALELVIFRILDGIGVSIFQVSIASYLGDLFPVTRGRMLSLYILLGGLGLFAGPFLVAPFTGNIQIPFAMAGLLGFAGVLLFLLVIPSKFREDADLKTHKFSLAALKERNVLLASISVIFFGVALFAEVSYMPVYVSTVLNFTTFESTFSISAFGLGAFFLAIPFGFLSDKIGRKPLLMLFASIQIVAGLVLFGTRPDFAVTSVMNFLYGAGWGIYFMNLVAIVQDSVPESMVGTAVGLIYTTFNIGAIFGGPLMGSLISISWTLAGLVSIAGVSVLTLVFILPMNRSKFKQIAQAEQVAGK